MLLVTPASARQARRGQRRRRPGGLRQGQGRALRRRRKSARCSRSSSRPRPRPRDAEAKIKAGASFDDIAKARKLTPADLDLGEVDQGRHLRSGDRRRRLRAARGRRQRRRQGPVRLPASCASSRSRRAASSRSRRSRTQIKKEIAADRAANDVQAICTTRSRTRASPASRWPRRPRRSGSTARTIAAVDAAGRDPKGAAGRLAGERRAAAGGLRLRRRRRRRRAATPRTAAFSGSTSPRSIPRTTARSTRSRTRSRSSGAPTETAKALSRQGGRPRQAARRRRDARRPRQGRGARGEDRRRTSSAAAAASSPPTVVAAVFARRADRAGSAATPDGRVVFKVTTDATPPFDPPTPGAKTLAERLAEGLQDGIVEQYVEALKRELGVTIDEQTSCRRPRAADDDVDLARIRRFPASLRRPAARPCVVDDAGRRPRDAGLGLSQARRRARAATCSCSNRSRAARSAAAIR